MDKNKDYKRKLLKIMTIGMAILAGGQPALAAYNRREIEAGTHFLEAIEEDEAVDAILQEILDTLEAPPEFENPLYNMHMDVAVSLPAEIALDDARTWSSDVLGFDEISDREDTHMTDDGFVIFPIDPEITGDFEEHIEDEARDSWDFYQFIQNATADDLLQFPAIQALAQLYGGEDVFRTLFDHATPNWTQVPAYVNVYEYITENILDENGQTIRARVDEDGNFIRLRLLVNNDGTLATDENGNHITVEADFDGIFRYAYIRDEQGAYLTRQVRQNILDEDGNPKRKPIIDEETGEQLMMPDLEGTAHTITIYFKGEELDENLAQTIRDVDAHINGLRSPIDADGNIRVNFEPDWTNWNEGIERFISHNITHSEARRSPRSYSTSGALHEHLEDGGFKGASKSALIAAVQDEHPDTLLGTEANRRHYPNYVSGLSQTPSYPADEAHYSRHIKVDIDGEPLIFTQEHLQDLGVPEDFLNTPAETITITLHNHHFDTGGILASLNPSQSLLDKLNNYECGIEISLLPAGFDPGSYYQVPMFGAWQSGWQGNFPSVGNHIPNVSSWIQANNFGFRVVGSSDNGAEPQLEWGNIQSGDDDVTILGEDFSWAPIENSDLLTLLQDTSEDNPLWMISRGYNQPTQPTLNAAPIVWIRIWNAGGAQTNPNLLWQKGTIAPPTARMNAVSYTTVVDEKFDYNKNFNVVKTFAIGAFDVPETDNLLLVDAPADTDNGNDEEENGNGTPPPVNGEEENKNDDNIQNDATDEENNDIASYPIIDEISYTPENTGQRQTNLPQTGAAMSIATTLGIAALGAGTTAFVNKKIRKHHKTKKK